MTSQGVNLLVAVGIGCGDITYLWTVGAYFVDFSVSSVDWFLFVLIFGFLFWSTYNEVLFL